MRFTTRTIVAAVAFITSAGPASASVIVGFDPPTGIPSGNDFTTELGSLGLTQVATSGISLVLDEDSIITFDVLGSESGFDDGFQASGLTFQEFTSFLNSFASPTPVGSASFLAGDLAGLFGFTSSGGLSANVGEPGLALFLGANAVSGDPWSVFYLGFDDQLTGPDGDFDDLIVRATVAPATAVPEPATWGMALLGFGVAGFAMRRTRRKTLPQAA